MKPALDRNANKGRPLRCKTYTPPKDETYKTSPSQAMGAFLKLTNMLGLTLALNLWCVDLPTGDCPDGSMIQFAPFWRQPPYNDGRNYSVAIRGSA